MKRAFVFVNKDGTRNEVEVDDFVIINSEFAPIFALERSKSGRIKLYMNQHYNITNVDKIEIVRED